MQAAAQVGRQPQPGVDGVAVAHGVKRKSS